jgi:hypothetical protein
MHLTVAQQTWQLPMRELDAERLAPSTLPLRV